MAGAVRVFIACSLDGFIAGLDDDLSWLGGSGGDPDEDYGYAAFMAETGALLMGRRTYDVVRGFDSWPYGDKPVFVATTRPSEAVAPSVRFVSGTPRELLDAVAAEIGDRNVYLDGGALIRAFLDEGLVDELTVTLQPTVLGAGVPLFAGVRRRRSFELLSAVPYASGLVQLRLRPAERDP